MSLPFLELVKQRVVVLDGAMGSNLQTRNFDLARDWQGHENISEILNFTRPEVIQEIHEAFLAVGCDAVETNTFGANKIVLAEAHMSDKVFENNRVAAQIARRACDKFATAAQPRYVVGSIGPGTKILTLGMTTWDEMLDSYAEQIRGLIAGGADVLLIETQQDILCIKNILCAARVVFREMNKALPIMVQASMDGNNGQNMLLGTDPSSLVATFECFPEVSALGLNCAFGPNELTESMRTIARTWPRFVSALPNAGLPIMIDGKASFPMNPTDFTKGMMRMVNELGVHIVGGCCGTMAEHLGALCEAVGVSPKDRAKGSFGMKPGNRTLELRPQISSLYSAEDIRQDNSYLIVAERTNTNGSRQFKRLLQEGNIDALVSMARDEIREGAHMLDVCVDFVGRDGISDMQNVIKTFVQSIHAPFMLDSTNPAVLEAGLKLAGGRCILNSMNLEDGEEKLAHLCKLATTYGAAVVAGTIDEDKQQAMGRTRERKLSIAKRIRDLAVNKYGLRDEDILFDPLVLPISTGIEEDRRNALETIEGTRLISQQLPKCHTVVGLSNVSFGLKPNARIVLNSAFLHELRDAGLTGAIVHQSKILPKNRIPQEQWDAAMDLIYDRRDKGFDPLTKFVGLFPDTGATEVANPGGDRYANLSIEEKLKKHIIDGEKRNLIEHLTEALKSHSALNIINNILLEGMKVVGELFGSGQMQLPFVLQSAETMKGAVAHLQQFMEKNQGSSKGRFVLATVKGDVHDIGKNLVDIILSNNGYSVINLGIKQPVQDILKAAQEHNAHAIGMSGLLVKSVNVMKENLEELNARGITIPVLLGGAALTREYAEEDLANLYKGAVFYCKDAFDGLHMMDWICAGKTDFAVAEQNARVARRKEQQAKAAKPSGAIVASEPIVRDHPVPTPPFWGRKVVTELDPKVIFPFINTNALFLGQWGLKKGKLSDAEHEKLIEQTAKPLFADLQRRAVVEKFITPKIVYGYFPVQSEGSDLIVYDPADFNHPVGCGCGAHRNQTASACKPLREAKELLRFTFPRQADRRQLCISDFYRAKSSGEFDVLAVQMVTVGPKSTELAEELRKKDKYQDYLYLHGFSVECAEALAEFWHKRVRQELGFGSEDDPSIPRLFQQKYRGSRYSFGYPACPNLEDRTLLSKLLCPEEIGVALSESYMLVPEQSTDAIVAHHPQAKYFDV